MRITDVQLTPIAIRRTNGFLSRHVIVEIKTDESITGIGEMSDFSHLPAHMPNIPDLNRTLTTALKGENPLELAKLDQLLLGMFPESDLIYDMSAVIRAGVSIALYDISGKWLGCPLSGLLGGGHKKSVSIAYPIFRQSDEAEVQRNLSLVEQMHSKGYTAYHVYVGQNAPLEIEFIAELRNRYGSGLKISVDGSNLLGWRESLKIARSLQSHNILYYESPALRNDVEGLAEFRRKEADVPVSEHVFNMRQAERLLAGDCLDVLNLTIVFAGGIRSVVKLLHAAEVFHKSIVIGTTQELAAGSAAQAHFSSAVTTLYPSHITGPLLYMDDVVSKGVTYSGGELLIPDGKGLGIELDEAALEQARDELVWESVSMESILHRKSTAK